jgi:hypothetical protein
LEVSDWIGYKLQFAQQICIKSFIFPIIAKPMWPCFC